MVRKGYQGRDMLLVQEIKCESWCHTDFAEAGQDAIAMVSLLYFICVGT